VSLRGAYADKPCFAVGAKTAVAAREAGFRDVREGGGSASDLAEIIAECSAGVVAYLAGRVRLPDFEEAMKAAGIQIEIVEVYDTETVEPSRQEIESLRDGRPIDATLIYSAKAADTVQRLATLPALSETFSHTVHCCLSGRIAKRLEGMVQGQLRIAERPEEAAILALLAH
jgi:uroporphyrinogen-III synthase